MKLRSNFVGVACLCSIFICAALAQQPAGDPPPYDQPRSNFNELPIPQLRFLTDKEKVEIKPTKDDTDGRYKFRVTPTANQQQLLGRQWFMPKRDLAIFLQGKASSAGFHDFGLSAPAANVAQGAFNRLACTFAPDDQGNASADILSLDFFLPPQDMPIEARLHGHTKPPWFLLFNPSGSRLVSCSDDGSIRLWDLNRAGIGRRLPNGQTIFENPRYGLEIANFPGYKCEQNQKPIRGDFAAFSPHGRWLATSFQQKVSMRSPENGGEQYAIEPLVPELPEDRRIMALRFDPNGNKLLVFFDAMKATQANAFKFLALNVDSHTLEKFYGTHAVVDGRATRDNKYVITWDGSSEIVFWDMENQTEIAALKVAPEHVYDVAISPMGDVVATAGDDGEVKFWKIADQSSIAIKPAIKHEGIGKMLFGQYGKNLITESDDGWQKQWDAPKCFWSTHEPGSLVIDNGTATQNWTDSVTVRDPDGNVTETFPNGTVKKYKQQ